MKIKKKTVSVCNLNWSDQVINTMETEENLLPFRLAEGASISIIRPVIQYILIPLFRESHGYFFTKSKMLRQSTVDPHLMLPAT